MPKPETCAEIRNLCRNAETYAETNWGGQSTNQWLHYILIINEIYFLYIKLAHIFFRCTGQIVFFLAEVLIQIDSCVLQL